MMTRDDIIRIAREAGLYVGTNISGVQLVGSAKEDNGLLIHLAVGELVRFAALVAAAERERLKWDGIHSCGNDCQRPACVQAREQRARVYEECAQAVAVFDKTFQTGGVIAHAIRARSNAS